ALLIGRLLLAHGLCSFRWSHWFYGFGRSGFPRLRAASERQHGGQRVAAQRQKMPVLSLVRADEKASVAQARIEPFAEIGQRIGHTVERLGQAATERLPGAIAAPPVDSSLGLSGRVCAARAGAGRDKPA